MRLKDSFITQEYDDAQIMVSTGDSNFVGLVRSNVTAAFIVDNLKSETTKEKIVDAMCKKYDAPYDIIEKSVENILDKLRSIGALDE